MNKIIKKILLCILMIILSTVFVVGGYCGYIVISYDRIGNIDLDINSNSLNEKVKVGVNYSATTYNIGFGAYSQDYTFFLDTGYDVDGKKTCGYYSTARSVDEVLFNVNGSIETVEQLNPDFILLQEVDVKSTRSYKIDQNQMFADNFDEYDSVFSCNFDTAFLPYPLYDMHGKAYAGLSTFSRYQVKDAYRCEYTISENLSKFFDCDRCFSVSVIDVENGKKLYIVNSHMSAYDKGGEIREKQTMELNGFLSQCKNKGDYVIVGGDFNHDLVTNNPNYNYDS